MAMNSVVPELLESGGRMDSEALQMSNDTLGYLELTKCSYSVKKHQILKSIDLTFVPGKLYALMGSSGAGKTTLITALAGRGRGTVTGEALINKEKITRDRMKQLSKVVAQHDYLEPVLTARQVLRYTAELALNLPKKEREERVEQVIQQLSLESCADVICGGPDLKGLSGGQLKRVSIGTELLSNPAVLFLDEPTSGLDSKVAEDVIDIIGALARAGRTVICTIHQPSFQVFKKFDMLVMLDKGEVAYDGPVAGVSGYLQDVGRPTPEFVNPADHFLFVMSQSVPNEKNDFSQLFYSTKQGKEARERMIVDKDRSAKYVDNKSKENAAKTKAELRQAGRAYPTSFFSQVGTIFRRSFLVTAKDKRGLRARLAQVLFISLILGTIYFDLGNKQNVVQDKLSLLFILVLFLGMSSIMQTAMAIPSEKPIILREYSNNYFSLPSFYFGRIGVLLLFQILYAVLFAVIVYFVVGFNSKPEAFAIFMVIMILNSLVSGAVGLIAGILVDNPQGAAAAVPMVIMPLTIFAGLFISVQNIPNYWIWLYYVSWFQYALQGLMINEFDGILMDPCTAEEFATPGQCPYGACNPVDPFTPLSCPGDVVLNRLEYDPDNLLQTILILVGFVASMVALGLLLLRRLLAKAE